MNAEEANEIWDSIRRQQNALRSEGAALRDKVLHLEEVKLDHSRTFWQAGLIRVSDRWVRL